MATGVEAKLAESKASPEAVPEGAKRAELMRQLFEEHNRALVDFLAVKLDSLAEAKDVAQEAYVHLLQLDHTDTISFLRAYLFRIAANIAIDHLRHRSVCQRLKPEEGLLFEQWLADPGPERIAFGLQQMAVLKEAIEELPEDCRRAFVLHLIAERPVCELASEMGLSERMIRYHVARGLAYCRAALDRGA